MSEEISKKLAKLPKQALLNFITSLYGQEKAMDSRIESLILQGDPVALHGALKKRVQSLKRSSRFIDYGASFAFSQQLDLLLSDIQQM